jgi:hypothetical protein
VVDIGIQMGLYKTWCIAFRFDKGEDIVRRPGVRASMNYEQPHQAKNPLCRDWRSGNTLENLRESGDWKNQVDWDVR